MRLMVDERRAHCHLGWNTWGTPGALVKQRSWDDYGLGRADAIAHLGALDLVYAGVVEGHRKAIAKTEEPDPVTQDMLIGQSEALEQFHWFVRAHLENSEGTLATRGDRTEKQAARSALSIGTARSARSTRTAK